MTPGESVLALADIGILVCIAVIAVNFVRMVVKR